MTHKETHGKNCICHSCSPKRVPLIVFGRTEYVRIPPTPKAQPREARR